MPLHRREFLKGLFAAPAIVAIGNIMPVRSLERLLPVLDPVFVYRRLFDDLIERYPGMDVFKPNYSGRLGVVNGVTFIEQVMIPVTYPPLLSGRDCGVGLWNGTTP